MLREKEHRKGTAGMRRLQLMATGILKSSSSIIVAAAASTASTAPTSRRFEKRASLPPSQLGTSVSQCGPPTASRLEASAVRLVDVFVATSDAPAAVDELLQRCDLAVDVIRTYLAYWDAAYIDASDQHLPEVFLNRFNVLLHELASSLTMEFVASYSGTPHVVVRIFRLFMATCASPIARRFGRSMPRCLIGLSAAVIMRGSPTSPLTMTADQLSPAEDEILFVTFVRLISVEETNRLYVYIKCLELLERSNLFRMNFESVVTRHRLRDAITKHFAAHPTSNKDLIGQRRRVSRSMALLSEGGRSYSESRSLEVLQSLRAAAASLSTSEKHFKSAAYHARCVKVLMFPYLTAPCDWEVLTAIFDASMEALAHNYRRFHDCSHHPFARNSIPYSIAVMMSTRTLLSLVADLDQLIVCGPSACSDNGIATRMAFQLEMCSKIIEDNVSDWTSLDQSFVFAWMPTWSLWDAVHVKLTELRCEATEQRLRCSLQRYYAACCSAELRCDTAVYSLRCFHKEWVGANAEFRSELLRATSAKVATLFELQEENPRLSTRISYGWNGLSVSDNTPIIPLVEVRIHIALSVAIRLIDITHIAGATAGWTSTIGTIFTFVAHLLEHVDRSLDSATSAQQWERFDGVLQSVLAIPHSFADDVHRALIMAAPAMQPSSEPQSCKTPSPHLIDADVNFNPPLRNVLLCADCILAHVDTMLLVAERCFAGDTLKEFERAVIDHLLGLPANGKTTTSIRGIVELQDRRHSVERLPRLAALCGVHANVSTSGVAPTAVDLGATLDASVDECLGRLAASAVPILLPPNFTATHQVRGVCLSIATRLAGGDATSVVDGFQRFLTMAMPANMVDEIVAAVGRNPQSPTVMSTARQLVNALHDISPVLVALTSSFGLPQSDRDHQQRSALSQKQHQCASYQTAVAALRASDESQSSNPIPSDSFLAHRYKILGDALLVEVLMQDQEAVRSMWLGGDASLLMRCWIRILGSLDIRGKRFANVGGQSSPSHPIEAPVIVELLSQLHSVLRCLAPYHALCAQGGEDGHYTVTTGCDGGSALHIAEDAALWLHTLVHSFRAPDGDGGVVVHMQHPTLVRLLEAVESVVQALNALAGNASLVSRGLMGEVIVTTVVDVEQLRHRRSREELHNIASSIGTLLNLLDRHGRLPAGWTERHSAIVWGWVGPEESHLDDMTSTNVTDESDVHQSHTVVTPTVQSTTNVVHAEATSDVEAGVSRWLGDARRLCGLFPTNAALMMVGDAMRSSLVDIAHNMSPATAARLLSGLQELQLHIPALSHALVRAVFEAPREACHLYSTEFVAQLTDIFRALLMCSNSGPQDHRHQDMQVRYATSREANAASFVFASPLTSDEVQQCGYFILNAANRHIDHTNGSAATKAVHRCVVGLQLLEILLVCGRSAAQSHEFASALCKELLASEHLTPMQAARVVRVASKLQLRWCDEGGFEVTPMGVALKFFHQGNDASKIATVSALVQDGGVPDVGDHEEGLRSLASMVRRTALHVAINVGLLEVLLQNCLLPLCMHMDRDGQGTETDLRLAAVDLFLHAAACWMQSSPALDWKRHVAVHLLRAAALLFPGCAGSSVATSQNDGNQASGGLDHNLHHCVLATLFFISATPGVVSQLQSPPSLAECQQVLFPWAQKVGAEVLSKTDISVALRLDAVQCLQTLDAWRRLDLPPSDAYFYPCMKRLEMTSRECGTQLAVDILDVCLTFGIAPHRWVVSLVLRLCDELRDARAHVPRRESHRDGLPLMDRALVVCRSFAEEHGVLLPHSIKCWTAAFAAEMMTR